VKKPNRVYIRRAQTAVVVVELQAETAAAVAEEKSFFIIKILGFGASGK
jgi:hypothetical protein